MSGLLLCGYSASIAATLASISVTPVSAVINIGQTQQLIATGTFSDGSKQQISAGTFQSTASPMTQARPHVTATTLKNGKVLVTGGDSYRYIPITSDIYDPATKTFSTTGAMVTPREEYTATLLPNGKVLIAGGGVTQVELYDPATGTYSAGPSLTAARRQPSATLLGNGKVLIAGGAFPMEGISNTADLYDPETNTVSRVASPMPTPRYGHAATLLGDGKVLIVGGLTDGYDLGDTNTSVLYDPATSIFSYSGNMPFPASNPSAILLKNGKVLVIPSAQRVSSAAAALYDPNSGIFSTTTGSMTISRGLSSTVTMLGNGKVLVQGGGTGYGYHSPTELYDPDTDTFSVTATMIDPRMSNAVALLANGQVLIVGGQSGNVILASAELYTPDCSLTATWVSSNTAVATIGSNGFVSGISPGVASLTATVGSINGSTTLTVVNQPPTANAGANQQVNEGVGATLIGTGSDPEGGTLTYSWTQTGGIPVSLLGTTTLTPTFTAPNVDSDTTLTFKLTVTDNYGATASATTSVIVSNVNGPDLVVTANSSSVTSVKRGRTFTFTSTTKNQGNATTGATTSTGLYLSTDTTITSTDSRVGIASIATLAVGSSQSVSVKVTVPSTLAPGAYYLGSIADYTGVVSELVENNNSFRGVTILVQ